MNKSELIDSELGFRISNDGNHCLHCKFCIDRKCSKITELLDESNEIFYVDKYDSVVSSLIICKKFEEK